MSTAAPPIAITRTGSGRPLLDSLQIQRGRGDLIDELTAITAMIVVPLDVPFFQAVRAPITLLILAVVVWRWRAVWPTLRAARYAFALPALCLVSVIWAADPVPAIRHGVLLALTMVIAGGMAARLDKRQFVVSLLLSQGLMAVWSVLDGTVVWSGGLDGGTSLVGIFPHKNVIGQRMMLLTLACGAVLLVRGYRPWLRATAMMLLPIALYLLVGSRSATAIILVFGAMSVLLFARFVWQPALAVRGARPVIASGLLVALPLALLLLEVVLRVDIARDLLGAFGKDTSLTGRTDIWALGNESVRDHPFLGVGAGNFWTFDSWSAVQMSRRMGMENVEGFNFHNAYYEAVVHLGLFGLLTALYIWGRGMAMIVWSWWTAKAWGDPFWVALAAALLVRSFTESELFRPTLPGAILFWFAVFAAEAGRRELSARRAVRTAATARYPGTAAA